MGSVLDWSMNEGNHQTRVQAELLDEALAGPVITLDQIRAAGVKIPGSSKDRKPRHNLASRAPSSSALQCSLL
ncbi:hypothetical protein [Streptomonospora arabica]|uniref:NADP-dependent oxidoreductase domain-containing protein n=1 Tax=Streptomonospora arabica TaxID=412417 RepID=A0ABV9SKR2_9ACTN